MAGDLLGISVTGLNLSQAALRTAGHNIANANTEGYTRQVVGAEANPEVFLGAGFVGNGVSVTSIERQANEFVISQLRSDTALASQQDTFLESASQLDNLLSNPALGMSDALQRFFAALQAGADNPTSIASRQMIISEGQSLVDRFNSLNSRLQTINTDLNQKLESGVRDANALLSSIATFNIAIAKTSGSDSTPNDLYDKRDQALLELSKLVGVRVNSTNDGMVSVSLTSGEALITGGKVNLFGVVNSPDIPGNKELTISTNIGQKIISKSVDGGVLGGLLSFRGGMLDKAFNEIGRVAVSIAGTFNEIHQQGIDLNGQFGGLMFSDINDEQAVRERVLHSSDNKPPYNRDMTLDIVDPNQLTGSDYRVEIEEGSQRFSIVRVSDGKEVVSNLLTGRTPQNVEFDGLKMTFSGGVFQGGDKFYLQPTRSFSKAIDFSLVDPQELAFAKPIIAESEYGNIGNAQIDFGEIISLEDLNGEGLPLFAVPGELSPPMIIRFTSPTRYDVLDNTDPNNPTQLDPPIRNQLYVPGQLNNIFTTDPAEKLLSAHGDALGLGTPTEVGATVNGYPAERFIITQVTDADTGASNQYSVVTKSDDSAKDIAAKLSSVPGVEANAWNQIRLNGFSNGATSPALPQIQINGVDLIDYAIDNTGATILSNDVPTDFSSDDFINYLATQAQAKLDNPDVQIKSITINGTSYLEIYDNTGEDIAISLSDMGANLSDTVNSPLAISNEQRTIGGRFDVTFSDGVSIESIPVNSSLLGKVYPTAVGEEPYLKSTYRGIQAVLKGNPEQGDGFTINFNNDASLDNRNIMSLVDMELKASLNNGKANFSEVYGLLVEDVGIKTSAAKISAQAGQGVLEQSIAMRSAISGVNLDEEAANLIKYEQMYSANAQAISVARDIFDRLINSI